MKVQLIALMIAVGLLAGCDSLQPDLQNNPLMQPDKEYELDTWGYNSEIYEFTPYANPDYSCVMLMLDNGYAVGFQCFPKHDVYNNTISTTEEVTKTNG